MFERFDARELIEQYICERYWPAGQSAENWRAKLTGLLVAQSVSFDKNRADEIERIMKMLDGTFDIEKDKPSLKELSPDEISKILKF